jgi:hypothetical protein
MLGSVTNNNGWLVDVIVLTNIFSIKCEVLMFFHQDFHVCLERVGVNMCVYVCGYIKRLVDLLNSFCKHYATTVTTLEMRYRAKAEQQ